MQTLRGGSSTDNQWNQQKQMTQSSKTATILGGYRCKRKLNQIHSQNTPVRLCQIYRLNRRALHILTISWWNYRY